MKLSLEDEASVGISFVKEETVRAEEKAKAKEAEKAAKAAAFNKNNANNNTGGDEFAGMSEEKKAKILKKRAEKEAKAKAKAAAKSKTKVSLFGTGTSLMVNALSDSSGSVALNNDVISDVTAIVEKLLSGGVQRKPKIPKGTRDYLPEQVCLIQFFWSTSTIKLKFF